MSISVLGAAMKFSPRSNDSVHRTWRAPGAFILIMGVAVLGLNNRAEAVDMDTVQALYGWCNDDREKDICLGYISGVYDTMRLVGAASTTEFPGSIAVRNAMGLCPNNSTTYGAAMQVFKNWAERHPEMWSESRGFGVMLALHEAWPCTEGGPKKYSP
jgi:Rap1a immunity proteins